ncbi:MAG TPA: STAS domain-containing protein [Acidimicrobiia bacterium]|nr:STAS domain-containing protein [Acidimicrobiia bacterium]
MDTHTEFGQAVSHIGKDSMVRVWGGFDSMRASLLSECLEDLVATGQRRITLDVSELQFADYTAVAILVGALTRIRHRGAEAAVSPQSCGAYRVLERIDPTMARGITID